VISETGTAICTDAVAERCNGIGQEQCILGVMQLSGRADFYVLLFGVVNLT
jgi:hypothetical protein